MRKIYSEKFVKNLFAEMSKTYGKVNILTSFGLNYFWRKKTVHTLPNPAFKVADLMTGSGGCLNHIHKKFPHLSSLDLIDWCSEMCALAQANVSRKNISNVKVLNCDARMIPVSDGYYDTITSCFGLKTFSSDDLRILVDEIIRILKPGGQISLLEISLPHNRFLKFFYKFYLKICVPLLGKILLGNPNNYRMLWYYTFNFKNCDHVSELLKNKNCHLIKISYLFGTATQIIAIKN